MANPISWLLRPALVRRLIATGRLAVRLLREPRVPWLLKVIPALALLYALFPVDLAPDILPILGQLDDLAILVAAAEMFVKLCPVGPTSFHQDAIARGARYTPMTAADDVIDAEFRRE
jgi:uncharacterized membrane protein YkvA (DUF1232 family)